MWTAAHRIPVSIYTDPGTHQRELGVFFYGPHWNYVGLDVEIPNAGDFKTTFIGERGVILIRDVGGEIHVLENRCRHKGIRLLQAPFGNVGTGKRLVCPYHQWCYKLDGRLVGVPYRSGVQGQGGYPAEFSLREHGLGRLQWTTLRDLVPPVPASQMRPAHWTFDVILPLLLRAGEAISAEEAIRRVLILEGQGAYSTVRGERFDIPSWFPYSIFAEEQLVLFSYSDRRTLPDAAGLQRTAFQCGSRRFSAHREYRC